MAHRVHVRAGRDSGLPRCLPLPVPRRPDWRFRRRLGSSRQAAWRWWSRPVWSVFPTVIEDRQARRFPEDRWMRSEWPLPQIEAARHGIVDKRRWVLSWSARGPHGWCRDGASRTSQIVGREPPAIALPAVSANAAGPLPTGRPFLVGRPRLPRVLHPRGWTFPRECAPIEGDEP